MDSLLFALSHEGFTLKLKRLITEPASTFVLDFALEVWLFIVDHGHCVANIHIQLPYHEVVSAQYWWYDIIRLVKLIQVNEPPVLINDLQVLAIKTCCCTGA